MSESSADAAEKTASAVPRAVERSAIRGSATEATMTLCRLVRRLILGSRPSLIGAASMLVRAVCYRATPLDTLVDKALAGATKGVHAIGPATPAPAEAATVTGDCLPALPPDANLAQKSGPAGL